MKICSVEHCENLARGGKGFCGKHYLRFKRNGDPLKTKTAPTGEPLRWLKEAIARDEEGCIYFLYGKGYGQVTLDGKKMGAHRAACFLLFGTPEGGNYQACHSCGNGHLGCVNPKHLYWGTQSTNEIDKLKHGTDIRGEKHPLAKLTEAQVIEIKEMIIQGIPTSLIAEKYSVSWGAIHSIKKGENWAWLK